jgi:hypothetical protein
MIVTRRFSSIVRGHVALGLTLAFVLCAAGVALADSLLIKEQGSFFVGGRTIYTDTLTGMVDGFPGTNINSGHITVDQMYVQYQIPEGGDWSYEIKWDGVRALAFIKDQKVHVTGRKGTPIDAQYPEVTDVTTQAVWAAAELLRFGGNFNKYVQSRDLVKQEGIIFRHLLRLILLLGEFAQVTPADADPEAWRAELRGIADQLTESCRAIDPASTDEVIQLSHAADVVEGEHVLPPGT